MTYIIRVLKKTGEITYLGESNQLDPDKNSARIFEQARNAKQAANRQLLQYYWYSRVSHGDKIEIVEGKRVVRVGLPVAVYSDEPHIKKRILENTINKLEKDEPNALQLPILLDELEQLKHPLEGH